MIAIIVDIYEGPELTPVVRHELYGDTIERAMEIVDSHMTTDAFFDAAMRGENFEGIQLSTSVNITEREGPHLGGRRWGRDISIASQPLKQLGRLVRAWR